MQAEVRERVDAHKVRYGREAAARLLQGIERLIVISRGQKVERWELGSAAVANEELAGHLLGPTGNLRAPTLRIGTTLVVGFHEPTYREVLGLE